MSEPMPGAVARARRRPAWAAAIVIMIAVGFLYLAFHKIKWTELLSTIRHARVWFLVLSAVIGSGNLFIRGLRWRILLTAEKPIAPATVFWANMVGYLGNNYLPARAGELIRSFAIGARGGIGTSFALATALTERIMDAIALVVVSLICALFLGVKAPQLATAFKIIGVVGIVGAMILFLVPRFEQFFRRLAQRLPFSERVRSRLETILVQFLLGIRAFQHPRRALLFLLFTAAIWLIDGLNTIACGHAFGMSFSLPQALILLAGLGLSSAIPSTPGYVGVYQLVAVAVLVPFGFAKSQVLAYIIVAQALIYLVVTFWGLLGIWRLGITWQNLRTGTRTPQTGS